jgi:hypothetical protein
LQASLSPILSTLIPKQEIVTETPTLNDYVNNNSGSEEVSRENENFKNKFDKGSFEREMFHKSQEVIQSSTNPSTIKTTTKSSTNSKFMYQTTPEQIITTNTASGEREEEVIEANTEDDIEQFGHTGSSDLSADHLIAPGSIVSQEITSNAKTIPSLSIPKPGKITKVFTPAPPANNNNNEINKLLSPFYSHQNPSDVPTSFDNEFQPNQIYQQTFEDKNVNNNNNNNNNDNQATAQYEREDMQWYFQNYHNNNNNNHSQSNPILNYNLQPYDNFNARSSSHRLIGGSLLTSLICIVITFYFK